MILKRASTMPFFIFIIRGLIMKEMKLDKLERLVLFNQFEILKNLNKDNNFHDYETLQEIVSSGYEGEYHRLFAHLSDGVPSYVTEEVIDTFIMYSLLKYSYSLLSEEDKKEINPQDLEWKGFDANHEPHYGVARFQLEYLKNWQDIGAVAINSHHSTRGLYPPMIAQCKKYSETYVEENPCGSVKLTKEQIKGVLKASQAEKERKELLNLTN